MERVASWSLRTGGDKAESRVAPSTCAMLSDHTTRVFQQFQHCSTWAFGSKCCEIQPCGDFEPPFAQSYASTDAPLSNPSSSTHTDSRNEDEGAIETWAAASSGCEGNVHTRQGLPHGCVAATGRATSVGLRNCSAASRKNARVDCETVCDGLATPRARSAQVGKMMRGRDWFHKVCVRKKRCLRVRLSVCDLACDTDIG